MQVLLDNQKRMEQKKDKFKRHDGDLEGALLTQSSDSISLRAPTPTTSAFSHSSLSRSIEASSAVIEQTHELTLDENRIKELTTRLEEAIQRHKAAELEIAKLKVEHEEKIIDMQLNLVNYLF